MFQSKKGIKIVCANLIFYNRNLILSMMYNIFVNRLIHYHINGIITNQLYLVFYLPLIPLL